MSQENQIEEGVGFFDFSQFDENPPAEEERKLEIPKEEQEEVETKEEKTPPVEDKEKSVEEETPKQEKEKAPAQTTKTNYAGLAKKYIEIGTWNDATIEVDGEEVVLSELEDLDEETFLSITQAQDEQKNSELQTKYINKEELDEISLKIIEISKNGGDIKEALKAKEAYIDTLNTYDLENELHQEDLVRQMYSLKNPDLSEDEIDNLVDKAKKDLVLDIKAKNFAENLKKAYNAELDNRAKQAAQAKEQRQKDLKELRKGLKENLSNLGITKEAALKPLLDSVTVETDNGYIIDQQFEELKKDPKELAEFILWKNHREDYKKIVSEKQTAKEKKDTLIKLNLIPNKHSSPKETKKQKPNNVEEELAARMALS